VPIASAARAATRVRLGMCRDLHEMLGANGTPCSVIVGQPL
jgi:hypothetical protein